MLGFRAAISSALLFFLLTLLGNVPAIAQSQDSPQYRGRGSRDSSQVFRNRVAPNWFDGGKKFWYRNDLAQGAREFILVDAQNAKREVAFDHEAVAKAMGDGTRGTHLPIEKLEFDADAKQWILIGRDKSYRWDADAKSLAEIEKTSVATNRSQPEMRERRTRAASGADSSITFENRSKGDIEIFWISGDGTKQSYGKIEAGQSRDQHTFGGHRWQIVNAKGEGLGEVTAGDTHINYVVDGTPKPASEPQRRRPSSANRSRDGEGRGGFSPDGKWRAMVDDNNLVVMSIDSDERVVLSTDGTSDNAYSQPLWSPDSKTIVAFREKSVERLPVHWIRSSPPGGGRAKLETRPYVLPGDAFPTYELNLFQVEAREQIKPEVDAFEHEWLRPRVRFNREGTKVTYEQTDRGHGRFRLIEVELKDGKVRNLIDEKTDTFIWTAHTENQNLSIIQWLEKSEEILYATEKNGWRQLILVDGVTGEEKQTLTPKGIVVRSVESIDEANRRVWFTASGREGQDPYLIHHAYASLDSGEMTWLTEGNGNHSIEFSPGRDYIIDTYSRVDMAPVIELRKVADGTKVCDLETADISALAASGWSPPEVFVAKGRDGETDIWGIICRPKNFDPKKKYPVIEDIYAGPQSSFVPKGFSPTNRYESLTRLGFIVVKMDGMGTANRSKAFHDVCWKNIKDGGFPDRILWMKAAAEKYPEMDLTRVGIYGTSAGGQNAAGGVLFHPEFYKVAVAACGCHDNRMDKASWNEQWMGYPVGPHYSECSNIDNAYRLKGKLLLIVGEMDTNVPPESTMRFADALIRADKDFDLLVVPNGGHGMGGAYGQRRMHDYFVTHLLPNDITNEVKADVTASEESKPADTAIAKPVNDVNATTADAEMNEERGSSSKMPAILSPPPATFFSLVPDRFQDKAKAFYGKYLDINGLPVVASEKVDDQALYRTYDIVSHMLAGRPDIIRAMQNNGMYLIIIGKDQVYTDMPEYSDHPDPAYQNERVRGTGGKPTSFGEENLLGLMLDRYDDESIGVHEFCHTIDGALRSMDPEWSRRLRDTYEAAKAKKLYEGAYAGSNAGEYWAEICQAYFDCNRLNNWNHGPIGTREQLKVYDPVGYELVRSIFRLSAEDDWRYTFPRPVPSIESPPAKFNIDPFYTKFTWAREFKVVGRGASDESMLIANDIIRKMFAYRHDILKALMAAEIKLVVLGKDESLADLPEFKNNPSLLEQTDLLARYLTYSPEAKLLVVSEENLVATQKPGALEDCHLIQVFADAIYQVAGTRPVDPDWEKRPGNVWQQYELRVQRVDERLKSSLERLFGKLEASGKWQGTQAIHSHVDYWNYGVLAYFDAVGQSPTPIDSPRAIMTREDLAAYDPELYQLISETMAYDHRVDWRLR